MTGMIFAKNTAKRAFSSHWGWRLLGPMLRSNGVIVLTYHRIVRGDQGLPGVPVEHFTRHMQWVCDNCDPITPDRFVERALHPSRMRPAVLVTFDDGYRDYHDLAWPVLERLSIPSLVFLATSFVDSGGMIWTDQVQWAALSTRRTRVRLPWSATLVDLPDANAREALGVAARAHLKTLPDAERRQSVDELIGELGPPPVLDRQMLNWDEVRRTMGLTTFGGHTHTHPILSRLDPSHMELEIRTCRERIEGETGRAPTYFAYPNGRSTDYTPETREILRRNGFTLAFATCEGIAGPDSDWMAVKRVPGDGATVADFAWLAAGMSRS